MAKKKENAGLKKFKNQVQRDKVIKLEIPAYNLKTLLEVHYNLKLKLIDKYTIALQPK